jgi:hypothetical protein
MPSTAVFIARALVEPDRAFSDPRSGRMPKAALLACLFIACLAGERLASGFYRNAHATSLAILEVDARLSGLMANAPAEAQARAREQMLSAILGDRSTLLAAVSITASGLVCILVLLEMWLVLSVVSQFFGGQEERTRLADRPSFTMLSIAFIPLALRRLALGVVQTFQSPEAASNALTLAEYRARSAVRLDLWSLLQVNGVPEFLAAAARMLSDPFFLWTLAIIAFGGRAVYRMPLRSSILQVLILVALLSLQAAGLKAIGLAWEI